MKEIGKKDGTEYDLAYSNGKPMLYGYNQRNSIILVTALTNEEAEKFCNLEGAELKKYLEEWDEKPNREWKSIEEVKESANKEILKEILASRTITTEGGLYFHIEMEADLPNTEETTRAFLTKAKEVFPEPGHWWDRTNGHREKKFCVKFDTGVMLNWYTASNPFYITISFIEIRNLPTGKKQEVLRRMLKEFIPTFGKLKEIREGCCTWSQADRLPTWKLPPSQPA